MPVTTPPGDETAAGKAGRGHLRASHADREQVIGTLKAAFVQGMLGKDEFDLRVGQALAARTYADLAALTADIPPGPAVARPALPPARARRRPLARAAAGSGICLGIVAAAVRVGRLADPGNTPGSIPGFWAPLCLLIAFLAVLTALGIFGFGVAASLEQRRTRRQLPPRPGPGGHALDGEQSGGTGHGPVPPGPGDGQARTDLRAHKPPQRLPARAVRTTRGVRPAPGTV
jgi:MFS family permease